MKGNSKISATAIAAALGGLLVCAQGASAQQYDPVSTNSDVQVNWGVINALGGQPTVTNYLSPDSAPPNRVSVTASDKLIYPVKAPHSAFLAPNLLQRSGASSDDTDLGTVVIDGGGIANAPSQSQFFGVPANIANRDTANRDTGSRADVYDDGANQVIALRRPKPHNVSQTPRNKPVTTPSNGSGPTQLMAQPAPKKPAAEVAEAQKPEPAKQPEVQTKSDTAPPPKAPPLPDKDTKPAPKPEQPGVPEVKSSDVPTPPTPAPDTTTSPRKMIDQQSKAEPAAPAAPAPETKPAPKETASVPPVEKDKAASAPVASNGADQLSLAFGTGSFELSSAAKRDLDRVISRLSKSPDLRIQLQAYAAGESQNASKARRLSLSRALQVRSYLIDKGVRSTRIDVRALGANVPSGPADRVDVKTVQR